jgi:FkbM family methyltransferase
VPVGEWYPGYTQHDLAVFEAFRHAAPEPSPGFVTDWIGVRTRTSSLWNDARTFGQVQALPIPGDFFEAVEWIGFLKSVLSARDRYVAMELGAGWGPWLVAGAVAGRLCGIERFSLLGVEADPGRFDLMIQHFKDNGLEPEHHRLLCAAVGAEVGRARWPRIWDAANAAGARPVRYVEAGRDLVDTADAAYMRGAMDNFVEVEILPFDTLLHYEPIWDLVHLDVQGWEVALCRACVKTLTERVRWLVAGTHTRKLDGDLVEIMFQAGWVLENEKPTRFSFDRARETLQSMGSVDGIQVWRNPTLL